MIETPETAERAVRKPAFDAPYVFVLTVVDGDDFTLAHRIDRRETIVGRSPEAEFTVDDETVSKQHCRLVVEGGVCTAFDLGSLNGTCVNARPLRPGTAQRLRHLDEILVGDVRLMLLAGKSRP